MQGISIRVAAIAAACLALQAAAPTGWYLAGSKPSSYDTGVDKATVYNGLPSAYLKSKQPVTDGFGTLMQDFKADQYTGKRVRFSAFVKTENVEDWAGLWMRVDDSSKGMDKTRTLAFDNMQNRALKGTLGWKEYSVVLDVPQGATGIFLGVLLSGNGGLWLNSNKFEVVGADVPTTGTASSQKEGPANLSFEK